ERYGHTAIFSKPGPTHPLSSADREGCAGVSGAQVITYIGRRRRPKIDMTGGTVRSTPRCDWRHNMGRCGNLWSQRPNVSTGERKGIHIPRSPRLADDTITTYLYNPSPSFRLHRYLSQQNFPLTQHLVDSRMSRVCQRVLFW